MTEETRAAHWAKIDDYNRRIQALEDERDALVLSDEDADFYEARVNPMLRELTRAAAERFVRCNAAMKQFENDLEEGRAFAESDASNGFQWKIGADLRIRFPESYTVCDANPSRS